MGHEHDQIAIYDVTKGEEIYTMSDKSKPSEGTGAKKITEAKGGNSKPPEQQKKLFFDIHADAAAIARALWESRPSK